MRGKNILWISWIAILLSVGMMDLSFGAVTNTKIVVEPSLTTGLLPGDKFWIDVNIISATNVYTWQFWIRFQRAGSVLGVLKVEDGNFGVDLAAYNIYPVDGFVVVIGTLWGQVPGVSGDGTLARIQFVVVEAGESPLNLDNTLLVNPAGEELPHQTRDGYYKGPTATLVRIHAVKRDMLVGETQYLYTKVKNEGDVPLYVKVRYDMIRDDMEFVRIGAGQEFTGFGPPPFVYLYANEYNPWLERNWANTPEGVLGLPDGSYAYTNAELWDGTTGWPTTSFYGFEDITLAPGDVIGNVKLEMYTQYVGGGDENLDLDVFSGKLDWLGSEWGDAEWGWHTPRWIGEDLSDTDPSVLTVEGLNNFEILFRYWTADHLPHTEARVDAARLRVELSSLKPLNIPVYVVEPGQVLDLDPAIFHCTSFDVGKYYVTVTCYFSYGGSLWNRSPKGKTFAWWITE